MRASSPLTWTDPIQPEEELLNHKERLYLQTPISKGAGSASPPSLCFFPIIFTKFTITRNYMSLLKVTGCTHCRLVS